MYDLIIIGAGPAGMTAAVYAGRANKKTLVIEKGVFGGQMTHSPKIENYPGFTSVSGNELSEKMAEQMMALGADIEVDTVVSVTPGDVKTVTTEFGSFESRAVIIAAGVEHRRLGVPGEEELEGKGVSYCAVCDGAFFAGKDVVMVGGGNSALQEALLLSEICSHVTVLQDLDFLTGEKKLADALYAKDNVDVITGSKVVSIEGSDEVTGVRYVSGGAEKTLDCGGVFIAIGLKPENEAFGAAVELDGYGYIASGETCLTSAEGIFAAGDCRAKGVRQIATAIADGATAALAAIKYLRD